MHSRKDRQMPLKCPHSKVRLHLGKNDRETVVDPRQLNPL